VNMVHGARALSQGLQLFTLLPDTKKCISLLRNLFSKKPDE
jgi:hypothetical protein